MGLRRRYPGTQPFTPDMKDIFFGRGENIIELVELINIEQLVVLYSKSGLGKSSMVNAGVIPKLEKEDRFIPITFRFGAYSEEKTETPLSLTQKKLEYSGERLLDKIIPDDNSLWYHLKNRQTGDDEKRGYLLIFDQFEELFSYPQEQIDTFGSQLAELLYTTIPERFRKVVETEMWEKGNKSFLTEEENRELHDSLKIKVMPVIRSDRMSLLNRLKDHVPHILKTCYELHALTREQAEDAILIPAFLKDESFESPVFDYDDAAIQKTLEYLTKGGKQEIASFQLQILCESVERKVINQNLKVVEEEHLGDIESLFTNYYDDQIETLGTEEEQLAARKLLEEALIFEEEERRLTLYEGIIIKSYDISPELLRKLLDTHLLRSERSATGDGYNYEISHDSLVGPILQSKEKRKAEEEQQRKMEEEKQKLEAERQRLIEEDRKRQEQLKIEQKKRRRNMIFAAVGFILSVIAILTSIYAVNAQREAEVALEVAKEAERKRVVAEEKRRSDNYNQYKNVGTDKITDGEYDDANVAFETAMKFAKTREDSAAVEKLIRENNKLWLEKRGFDRIMVEVDSASTAEEDDLKALELLVRALEFELSERDRQKAEAKMEVLKKGLEPMFNEHVNNAQTYDKINECGLVRQELREANRIRQYLSARSINPDVLKLMDNLKCRQ